MKRTAAVVVAVLLFLARAGAAQFAQQGSKLVGTGAMGPAQQGNSAAISADGNTAIVGGREDNTWAGAVWVFTRSGGVWSQQGDKLVGTGAAVTPGGLIAWQGVSVGISADGNTAIVGGFADDGGFGAAWVFTRSGGVWSQQGSKLVGSGAVNGTYGALQGNSVAISADGNTAIVGGPLDNSGAGAAWVYTRSGGVWLQLGSKLVGTGAVGDARQGQSVAMSADGNTAIVGGPDDNSNAGAAWVYTRSGGVWSQQGSKLAGTGAVGYYGPSGANQGSSVAISTDGSTAIVGGSSDNTGAGAAWVYTRSRGVWSQQGDKLVGADAEGAAQQGNSVTISADGNTAIVGGPLDNSGVGAAWVYTRNGGMWLQVGSKLVGDGSVGAAEQGLSVAISADGTTAILGGPYDNSPTGAAWVFTASTFSAWVPVASHTSGKNNSQWRSDLGLLNPGTVTANVQIGFYGSGGVVSNTTSVPAGTQSILTDVVGQLGASGSGALEILSDQPVKVTARSYNQVALDASCDGGGTQGQDYPAVVASNGLAAGESAFLAGLTENASYRTNIGVVNTGTGSATVLVTLYDGAGNSLANYTVPLTAGQWAQATQPFLTYASQTAMDSGYAAVTVQTGSGVFAFASVIDNITNDPTTVAMRETAPALVVWVPVASYASGLNQSQWRSDLGLLNNSVFDLGIRTTANVQIAFYGTSGTVTNTTTVAVGAQSILTDVVGQLGGTGSGALKVTSDQPLEVTARTYNQVASTENCYANGTEGQDYPAVVSSGGLGAGQSAYLAGLTENASYRCNIGVVNIGTAPATVLVTLFDGEGDNLGNYTVSLAAGQWSQATQPFLNDAGQTAMDSGYATITVQTGSGVFGFASVIDNITNDPTTVAMQQ
jgi:hypothetical protein